MLIKKCDICKKPIKKEELTVYFKNDRFDSFNLCFKCSQPIIKFLKSKKLIKSTDEKRK